MKPAPPPVVPGKTEAERFDNALRTVFSVPKVEIDRREAEWQHAHPKHDGPPSKGQPVDKRKSRVS